MKHHIILFFILTTMPIFTQAQTDRFIPFERIENGRDLGGLTMQDGRRIKPYRLVRSGNLSRASDADVAILTERFALNNVYDFRFDAEANGAQDRQIAGASYTSLSTLPKAFIEGFSSGRTDTTQIKSADVVDHLKVVVQGTAAAPAVTIDGVDYTVAWAVQGPTTPSGDIGGIVGDREVTYSSEMNFQMQTSGTAGVTVPAGGNIQFCIPATMRNVKRLSITGYDAAGQQLFAKSKDLDTPLDLEVNHMYNIPSFNIN